MATGIEDRVETFLLHAVEVDGLVQLSFRIDIVFEADRKVGPEFRFVTLGVERRTTAFRGCQRNLSPGILENEVGSSELFEPEARLSSCVTELVVGRDKSAPSSPSPVLVIIE